MTKSIVFVNLQRKGDLKLASKTCLDCNALSFKGSMEFQVIKVCNAAFKNKSYNEIWFIYCNCVRSNGKKNIKNEQ